MAVTDAKDYLDRRYENAQIAELPDAPIDALKGLGRAGGDALRRRELGGEDVSEGR